MIQKIDGYFNYTGERLDGNVRLCILSYGKANIQNETQQSFGRIYDGRKILARKI
ncbi:hypothetical protein [Francisella sp. SYW-9]|uniref:hypothetical protein n=1 Tax=Francisella sp. SYW-9 TaxID=2610888 RepID=UPI00168CB3AC|nr:hypothetical protein [Francisella sp. SYW-9]